MRNMDGEPGAMLTQSTKALTHRVRCPPFWLIVTVLDRNCYLPVWWGNIILAKTHILQNAAANG